MTWHVGAIMNEPQTEVLRFAAWYFEAGAHGMTLFFDNPDDPAAAVLEDHPNVTVIRCTPEFWDRLGLSPETRFPRRQNAAMTWLYRQCTDSWLLNVDADEFMYIPTGVDRFLNTIPEDIEAVRIQSAEKLLTGNPANGFYRLPMERDAAKRVYGDAARFFGPKRKGLVGHPQGKSFIRTGIDDISLRQHWAQSTGGRQIREAHIEARTGYALLHHVGDNYEIWREKVQWRIASRGFTGPLTAAIQAALDGDAPETGIRAIYDELHLCDADRLDRLKAEGALMQVMKSPDQVYNAVLG